MRHSPPKSLQSRRETARWAASEASPSGAHPARLSNDLYIPCVPAGADLTVHSAWQFPAALREAPHRARRSATSPLYTAEQKKRRDASRWTLIQGILAPLQFLVFLVSLALVLRFLATGEGLAMATASVIVKTIVLYVIMVTGSIWEKDVFGRYLFAEAFFWEDAVSMIVLALHTAYLAVVLFDLAAPQVQMWIALAAYITYVVNAAQFVLKLRAARLQDAHFGPALMTGEHA